MAEVFGVVAGALSVAALFNNCVDCFEFVQLGRSFGRDFERCQLRLDIARVRLGRWGELMGVNNDPRFSTGSPTDKSIRVAQSALEEIALLFESARKTSKRYELVANQGDLDVFEDKDMNPTGRALHHKLKVLARSRQERTSLARKTAWALYDGRALEKVVSQIAALVDELEKIAALGTPGRRLAEIEIQEVEDEASLAMLEDAARAVDPALAAATARKIAVRNSAKNVNTEDSARVQVGSVFTETALQGVVQVNDETDNSVEVVFAKGESGVHIGNTYGGRGLWDR